MTSRDYDVIPVTSQSSKLSHLETGTQINYPCGPFNYTLAYNIMLLLLSYLLALFLFSDEFKVVFLLCCSTSASSGHLRCLTAWLSLLCITL